VKIYLCRHANREPNGREKDAPVPLTSWGHERAKRLGLWLSRQGVTAVYSSPKVRAYQTAVPAADCCRVPVVVWPCLTEHDQYGPLDYDEPALWLVAPRPGMGTIIEHGMLAPGTLPEEDENFAYARAQFALRALQRNGDQAAAVFAHEHFNSFLIWAWLGHGPPPAGGHYRQGEACVSVLESGPQGGTLTALNLHPADD
jgi:broad specificity phosphatase PhoE